MYQCVRMLETKKLAAILTTCALAMALVLGGCSSEGAAGDTDAATSAQTASQGAPSDSAQNAEGVTVSVVMPEGADAESQSAEVSIPAEGTVYDALMATGWDVQAEDGEYGKYVTSINGVANGSLGDMSGWVFTVNGEQVMEGCDACKLAAGDTVEWTFFV